MKKFFRVVWGIGLGFLQAFLLGLVCSWLFGNYHAGAKVFLLGWPLLAWLRLRKPARARSGEARQPKPLPRAVPASPPQVKKTSRDHLKKTARICAGILLALLEAVAVSILVGCFTKSFDNFSVALLLGWPALIWRRLRKLSAPADQRPSLARSLIAPLIAVPVTLAVLLYTLFAAITKGSGSGDNAILAFLAVALLSGVFYLFWGGAIGAFLLDRESRKKKKS